MFAGWEEVVVPLAGRTWPWPRGGGDDIEHTRSRGQTASDGLDARVEECVAMHSRALGRCATLTS